MKHILSVVAFAATAMAQAGPYERCGGKGWYGATKCVAGFTCTVSNEWYSQCVAVPFNSNNTNIAGPYGQCGGKAWNGTTICTDGYSCKYVNDWYSQCVLNWALPTGSAPATVVTMTTVMTSSIIKSGEHTPTTTPSVATTTATSAAPTPTTPAPGHGSGKLEWVGVDESAAEFGPGQFPGVAGTDYTFPDEDNISGLIKEGYNIFRIPFAMERMVAPSVSSPLQKDYLNGVKKVIESITKQGKHAILDPHNHGRYKGNVITDTDAFKSFWTKLAGEFRDNELVIFDTNNEYFDMESSLVLKLNQAAIDGIRGAGAKTQYIMVEGNSYSGAWTWPTANDNLKALVDPSNKIIYEMHQYLDQDGGGTSADCVSSTIGVQRITAATKWLRDNKKTGVLGEFAAGANKQCKDAIKGMLDHIAANSDVWKGVLWWGGGPWWHNYIYSFEAPSGDGYKYYNDLLKSYVDA